MRPAGPADLPRRDHPRVARRHGLRPDRHRLRPAGAGQPRIVRHPGRQRLSRRLLQGEAVDASGARPCPGRGTRRRSSTRSAAAARPGPGIARTGMHRDRRGLELTAANAEAARHFDAMLEGYLAFDIDTGLALKAALKADPAMPLALATGGYIFKLLCSRAGEERARKACATATTAAAAQGASERERLHIAAL